MSALFVSSCAKEPNLSTLIETVSFTETSNSSVEASYSSVETYYKITWKNYNGVVLEIDQEVKANTTPTYDGPTPTKPEDSSFTYTFSGWSPKVTAVTSDMTYTATFTSTPKGPEKVTIGAHTIKDNNPPVDSEEDGESISKSTWNSFKNASASTFINHYNYTYEAYSGGVITLEKFTKNGYYVSSSAGKLIYERKSGNTFYQYISVSDGYLRQETSLNLQEKYTERIQHEIYVHMFEFEDYEFNEDLGGYYTYNTSAFSTYVKFQNGYLTNLTYMLYSPLSKFEIKLAFKTEIDVPQSYYYK